LLWSRLVGAVGCSWKAPGGLEWLARAIARFARGQTGRRTGELSIAALSATADVFTANNTVAILVSGEVARDIARRHGISPRRAASVLDIFACVPQGLLPYGAQILLAAGLASVSPLALSGPGPRRPGLPRLASAHASFPGRAGRSRGVTGSGPSGRGEGLGFGHG